MPDRFDLFGGPGGDGSAHCWFGPLPGNLFRLSFLCLFQTPRASRLQNSMCINLRPVCYLDSPLIRTEEHKEIFKKKKTGKGMLATGYRTTEHCQPLITAQRRNRKRSEPSEDDSRSPSTAARGRLYTATVQSFSSCQVAKAGFIGLRRKKQLLPPETRYAVLSAGRGSLPTRQTM